jgi:membrane protease YdiL (CAAX protease family)
MDPQPGDETTPDSGPRLPPWTTVFYAALWAAVVVQGWGPLVDSDPLLWLEDPERSAERMTVRDLELAEAIERSSGPTRIVLDRLYGGLQETILYAVEVHREVRAISDTPGGRARTAVLLSEAGRADEARDVLAADGIDLRDLPALEAMGLSPDWIDRAERLGGRLADEAGNAEQADRRILARGETWKRRALAVLAANMALVALGACCVVAALCGHLPRRSGSEAPWPLADGVGVFVRGDFWNRFYFLGLVWLWAVPVAAELARSLPASLLHTWGTLFASLPLVWLVHRHLLRPHALNPAAVFGLAIRGRGRWLLGIGLAAIAIDLTGTHAISWATWWIGVDSSWAEGFDDALVWGSGLDAFFTAMDYVVWTPVFEELAFRGLLYFSLRRRFGIATSALATAGFFALLHFYSLPGFLMTLWSGCVWALAFEHARSLWPGIAAHAVYNGLYLAGVLLLYR